MQPGEERVENSEEDEEEEDDLCFGIGRLDLEKEYFCYEAVEISQRDEEVAFIYSHNGVSFFQSTLHLPGLSSLPEGITIDMLAPTVFHIGLCVLPWFWLGFAVPSVKIRAGYLNGEQREYWEKFYLKTLGEFFVVNEISVNRSIKLEVEAVEELHVAKISSRGIKGTKVLVPLGGGKDSIVVFESMLRAQDGIEKAWMYVADGHGEYEDSWRLREIVATSRSIVKLVEHEFHSEKWERCRKTRFELCGHPWSALCAFDSVLIALVHGFNFVAVGNERSANFGNNIIYEGMEINHQYDKSFEFEYATNQYIKKNLVEDLHYFSALQNLWEVQIARLFALDCQNYINIFISCNEIPEGGTRWCATCDKCAFVFGLLSAWLPPRTVWGIFGDNLFERPELLHRFRELLGLGVGGRKPLECVGTPDEMLLSLFLSKQKYVDHGHRLPLVLASLSDFLTLSQNQQETLCALMTDQNDESFQSLLPPFIDKDRGVLSRMET